MSQRNETEEERRIRKEKERAARANETEEERRIRKEKERAERDRGGGRQETEEERRIRKEKERAARANETEEERRIRKEKERAERDAADRKERRGSHVETDEERRIRKEKERAARANETEEERRIRKDRERAERDRAAAEPRPETEEERRIRKEKERAARANETDEERRIRKEKERSSRGETDEERRARKEKERAEREQKEKEKAEERSRREVVHKPLPQALGAQSPKHEESPKVEKKVAVAPKAAPKAQDEDDYDEYADDFEDEVFDAGDLAAAQKAVDEENRLAKQRAAAAANPQSPAAAKEPEYQGTTRAGFDHNSLSRQKNKVQFEKDLERATVLRRLVDLDESRHQLTDFSPMSQYDLYLRGFGGVERKTAMIQAPAIEDKIDIEVQAERVQSKNRGCQAPADLGLFPERLAQEQHLRRLEKDKSDGKDDDGDDDNRNKKNAFARRQVDAAALGSFLSRVFPVVRTLLDENEVARNPSEAREQSSPFTFTSSATKFQSPIVAGRKPVKVTFSQLSPQYVLVAHGTVNQDQQQNIADPPPEAQAAAAYKGIALLWNINDKSRPDKVLVSHARITDVCFSPTKAHLIYGGTENGSVCVWDTREPDHAHPCVNGTSLRIPSYATDWHHADNHLLPVQSIQVAGYNASVGTRVRGSEETEQLMSMDQNGSVHFWMVNDANDDRGGAGGAGSHGGGASRKKNVNDADYAQNILSSVRLFKAAALNALEDVRMKTLSNRGDGGMSSSSSGSRGQKVGFATMTDLEVSPTDASHLLVGGSGGIVHVSKFGNITAPSVYAAEPHQKQPNSGSGSPTTGSSSNSNSTVASSVRCVRCAPTDSRLMLAGYTDGTVRLFLREKGSPQLTLTVSTVPIVKLAWTHNRRWLAFALDADGKFYVLDLAVANKSQPVAVQQVESHDNAFGGPCASFSVSKEERPETRLAFGYANGGVEVHVFKDGILAPPAQRHDNWL